MNPWPNATLALALVAGSTAEAQRPIRSSGRALASSQVIGLIGDGGARSVFVFDANTDTIIGQVNTGFGPNCYGDSVITSDLSRAYVATLQGAIWVIDLTTSPPSLASGTNPFEITNFGFDLALTADDRFLLVAAGNTPQEVAVVDLSTQIVVDEFGTGQDTVAVDVGPDGSVLIASENLNRVRRLTIDGAGQLTDTGEFLVENFALNVYALPSGVGLVISWLDGLVRSFTVPGLTPIETLPTAGTGIAMAALSDPSRNRIYVRQDRAVQAYPFDAATGDFGTTPIWNVPASNIPNCFGIDRLTLHPDGSKLYNTGPRVVQIRDPESGAVLATLAHAAMRQPSTITIRGLGAEVEGLLDVRPGACPNSFNRDGHGVLPVALIGTEELDVTLVDITTLRLSRADGGGGSVASLEDPAGPHTQVADVSTPFEGESCGCHKLLGDGILDLESVFESDALVTALELGGLAPGALVELALTGELLDGTRFSARDCVRLVAPGTPEGVLSITTLSRGWIQISPLDLALDGGGFGSFQRNYPIGTNVTLLASEVEDLPFVAWEVDGVQQKVGERTLQHHVKAAHAELRAIYDFKRTKR
jgi:hypothetical protein